MLPATAESIERSERRWRLSLSVSLALHWLLFAGMTAWYVSRTMGIPFNISIPPAPELEMTYTRTMPVNGGGGDIVDNIMGSIPIRLQDAKNLSPDERAQAIQTGLADLDSVSEGSLNEIADLFDVADRAYAPVIPAPDGIFDIDSQIPYSMSKTDNGGYDMILLDKNGRTMQISFPPEEVTEDLHTAYKAFRMMEEMPSFRKVYMRMMVQFMPQMMGGETHGDIKD